MSDFVPRRNPSLVGETLPGGEAMISTSDGEVVYVLNETAAVVWELCDGVRSVRRIADFIAATLSVDSETVTQDVDGFVRELESKGLLADACP